LENRYPGAIFTSAAHGENLDALLQLCCEALADRIRKQSYRIPQTRGDVLNLLHRDAKVLSTSYEDNDILVEAIVPESIAGKLSGFSTSPQAPSSL
jgi:GTP-binding protein HflX